MVEQARSEHTEDAAAVTVAEAFYAVLRAHGITKIFGNPGSNELTMLKHLPDDIEYVLALQEGAALAMAEGYARMTGTVGVVNLHSSSGSGNAMGNLTNSAAGHAPLVILAGQQSRRYVPFNAMLSNVDATALYDPLVKWSGEPLRPEDGPLMMSKALMLAAAEPTGPVFLSIPLDDWDRPADTRTLAHLERRSTHARPVLAPASVDALSDALRAAADPVLVLGPGVDDEQGWAAAVRLAESQRMPVWVAPSPSRAPFPTRHPLFRGILPTGLGAVAERLDGHDLVLTFGAAVFRYHQWVDGDLLAPGTSLIGVTSDPDEATRAGMGTLFVGDPSDALARVAETAPHREGREAVGDPVAPARVEADTERAPFSAEAILDAVDRAKPAETAIFLEWTSADALWARLSLDRPRSYFFPASGGLGWGLPAAIGAAMAEPHRPVVALIGDGAMQYTPAALWTAARYRVPVTFVVCQNEEYGALQRFATVMQVPDAPYLDLPGVDPASVARGYGVEVERIESLGELERFLARGSEASGPRLAVVPQRSAR